MSQIEHFDLEITLKPLGFNYTKIAERVSFFAYFFYKLLFLGMVNQNEYKLFLYILVGLVNRFILIPNMCDSGIKLREPIGILVKGKNYFLSGKYHFSPKMIFLIVWKI